MSTALVKKSLQLLEESDPSSSFSGKKYSKKTKRNTGDIRKAVPLKIEKIREAIEKNANVDVKKNVKVLLKADKSNTSKKTVDLLNKLTQKSTTSVLKKKKRKSKKSKSKTGIKSKGSVFTEEDFARIAGEQLFD